MERHWIEELNDMLDKQKLRFLKQQTEVNSLVEGQKLTREQATALWNKIEDMIIEEMIKDMHNGETK